VEWANPWAAEHAAALPTPLAAARLTVAAAQRVTAEAAAAAAAEAAAAGGLAILTRSALDAARPISAELPTQLLAPLADPSTPKLLTSAETQAMRAKMLPYFDATTQQAPQSWSRLPADKTQPRHSQQHGAQHALGHHGFHHTTGHHGMHHGTGHENDHHGHGHHSGHHSGHSSGHSSSGHSSSGHHSSHSGHSSGHHSSHHSDHSSIGHHGHSRHHGHRGHPQETKLQPPPSQDPEEPVLPALGLSPAPLRSRHALMAALRAAGLGPAGFAASGLAVHPTLAPLAAWPSVTKTLILNHTPASLQIFKP
jgi:hypothetical protein